MLNTLLKNQTIQVDAHERGTGENPKWDSAAKDIHIHKRTKWRVHGQRLQVDIKVPINSDRDISIHIPGQVKDKAKVLTAAYNQLVQEIKKTLLDKNTRTEFINDLLEVLGNYEGGLSTLERARAVVKRLGKHFGLPAAIEKEIKEYAEGRLASFVATFAKDGNRYFIAYNRDSISLGELGTIRTQLKDRKRRR